MLLVMSADHPIPANSAFGWINPAKPRTDGQQTTTLQSLGEVSALTKICPSHADLTVITTRRSRCSADRLQLVASLTLASQRGEQRLPARRMCSYIDLVGAN